MFVDINHMYNWILFACQSKWMTLLEGVGNRLYLWSADQFAVIVKVRFFSFAVEVFKVMSANLITFQVVSTSIYISVKGY